MDAKTDDEYDHLSDCAFSAPGSIDGDYDDDSDEDNLNLCRGDDKEDGRATHLAHDTPGTSPPVSTPRQSATKTIQCPYPKCYKAFNRQTRLKEHLRSHTNTRPYKCPHTPCVKDFIRSTHLRHHIKSAHTNARDYECTWPGCSAKFVTGTRLRNHIQTHEGKERFRCRGYDDCNQTFRKHDTLKRHIMSVHEKMKPFPCNHHDSGSGKPCTKAFETAEKLRQHQRTRHDPTRFSCSDCVVHDGQSAAEEKQLRDNEPLVTFATYSELQAHMRSVHPPTCPHCPTSFVTNKELTRHLELLHDGYTTAAKIRELASFPCTVPGCPKVFSKRGNLNVHVRSYHEHCRHFFCGQPGLEVLDDLETDVPFSGCGRGFASKASLEEHLRTAHLGMPARRTVRERKRKAEKESTQGSSEISKKRKPRKDKGVKKTSAIAELLAVRNESSITQASDAVEPSLELPARLAPGTELAIERDEEENKIETQDDDYDETVSLTGSMILYDNHIYHRYGEYHYPSGEYPTSHPPSMDSSLVSSKHRNMKHDQDEEELIFGNFEHDLPTSTTKHRISA